MPYIITKDTLTRWIGEGSARNLPSLLVLSRMERDSYRLEPLNVWFSRRAIANKKRVIPKLCTVGDNRHLSDTG